jgi:putative transposase
MPSGGIAGTAVSGAQLVQDERYLHAAVRYAMNNPVKGALSRHPSDWPWSSYRASIGLCQPPEFLAVETLWRLLGCDSVEMGRQRVRELVDTPEEEDGTAGTERASWLAGDAVFAARVMTDPPLALAREIPVRDRFAARPSLEELFAGVKSKSLRDDCIRMARLQHGYRLNEIGHHLGLHYSTVSKVVGGVRS